MTKVLIDSSAWIHFLRKTPGWYEMVATVLKEDRALTCGLIMIEVFRGARSQKEKKLLEEYFDLLEYGDLSKQDYREAADLAMQLAKKGFMIKTVDLLIGHLALKNKWTLLHDDSDFEMVARHTNLQTVTLNS